MQEQAQEDQKAARVTRMVAEMLQKTDPKRLEEGTAEMRKALEYYGSHTWMLGAEVADYLLHPAHLHPFPLKAVFDLPLRQDPCDPGVVTEEYHTSTRPVIVSPALALRIVQHSARIAEENERLRASLHTANNMAHDLFVARHANIALGRVLKALLRIKRVKVLAGRAGVLRRFELEEKVDGSFGIRGL